MWPRILGGGLILRTIARELGGIHRQLQRQGDLIERLLQVYAPHALAPQTPASAAEVADTGISFVDGVEAALVGEYVQRTQTDTGRAPTDDEILSFLADEKTVSLHARLQERVALLDLERLQRGSRS